MPGGASRGGRAVTMWHRYGPGRYGGTSTRLGGPACTERTAMRAPGQGTRAPVSSL